MSPLVVGAGIVASYFFGTFPSALMVAKRGGVDVTAAGSGNPGTSNVVRLLGWKYGAVVFALDMAKGAIAAVIGWQIDGTRVSIFTYVCVVAAIIGHTFPVTRRFKGGKGVATGGGAMYVLHPAISLVLFTSWFIIRRLTKKSSVASLAISIALPIAIAVDGAEAWEVTALVAMVILIVVRHVGNIQRLRSNKEPTA